MRLASSTSCAAVSSGMAAGVAQEQLQRVRGRLLHDRRRWRRGRGLLLLALGLRDLDPALLELAEDGVRLERVEVQRLEHLDQLGIAKRPVLLRLFEQVVQLGSRQHVLDFDRGHPCNLASCHEAGPPKPSRCAMFAAMHDNGCYVKLRHEGFDDGSTPAASVLDQKNSPSRSPFRPPFSLTFPLRVLPSNSASTYSGSVLGARKNLGAPPTRIKGLKARRGRNLRKFNYPHFHSRACSLWITPKQPRGR